MNINKENIEALLYDYAENNLDSQMRQEFELFLEKNPAYKQMLLDYDPNMTIPTPNNCTFNQKNTIINLTERRPKRILFYFSISAAAILLVVLLIPIFNNNKQSVQIAKINNEQITSTHNYMNTNSNTSVITIDSSKENNANLKKSNINIKTINIVEKTPLEDDLQKKEITDFVDTNIHKSHLENNTVQTKPKQDSMVIYVVVTKEKNNQANGQQSRTNNFYNSMAKTIGKVSDAVVNTVNNINSLIRSDDKYDI